MLVGDWVLVSKDGLLVEEENSFYLRFSSDGAVDVFDFEDEETSPGDPWGYWSANQMTIKVVLGEWEMLEFLRYGNGNSPPFEMHILKLTDTELILEEEGVFRKLKK